MIVFRLSHEREDPDVGDTGFHLGTYSSRQKAEEAMAFLRTQPGFIDFPNDFIIDEELVDQIHWAEGFVTDYIPDEAPE